MSTEHYDVLDDKGNKTGEALPRSEVHAKGLWHRAAHIWIMNGKGELLIQRRSPTKYDSPNIWTVSVAGHISAGEESMPAALREIKEEVGIEVTAEECVFIGVAIQQTVTRNNTYFNNEFNDVYLVRKDIALEDFVLQEEEVAEVRYISVDEFKKWVAEKKADLHPTYEEYELLFDYLEKYPA